MIELAEGETLADALRSRLGEYDGKATSLLGEAEAAFSGMHGYIDALITLIAEPHAHIANGASWLLKSSLERGFALTGPQVHRIVSHLPAAPHWAVQLHICQSIRFMELPRETTGPLAHWLCDRLDHERPFVRAWALDGLGAVVTADERFKAAFASALASAREDPAASVRARARNLAAG